MALRRFVIERDIPKVGSFEREQLRQAAAKSNEFPWASRTLMHETGIVPVAGKEVVASLVLRIRK